MNMRYASIADWRRLAESNENSAPRAWQALLDKGFPRGSLDPVLAAVERNPEWKKQSGGGILNGVPCLVKDVFDLEGFSTRASSLFLERVRPGPHPDGALARDLRKAGLVVAGKTHLNEFAYGLDGRNPHYGDCPHPFLPGRLAGGSSSGSAWAVAAGLVPLAFGTDTGGSIRVPSAFCGLIGLRLPPNAWLTDGYVPLARKFDTPGWMTRNVADMRLTLRGLGEVPRRSADPRVVLLGRVDGGGTGANGLAQVVRKLGGIEDADLEKYFSEVTREAVEAFNVLQSLAALELHKEWLCAYGECYDPATRERIERGFMWTPSQVNDARDASERVDLFFEEFFRRYDVGLLPVSDRPLPSACEMDEEFRMALLGRTAPASLARLPVLTLPLPEEGNAAMGVQCLLAPDRWRDLVEPLLDRFD